MINYAIIKTLVGDANVGNSCMKKMEPIFDYFKRFYSYGKQGDNFDVNLGNIAKSLEEINAIADSMHLDPAYTNDGDLANDLKKLFNYLLDNDRYGEGVNFEKSISVN